MPPYIISQIAMLNISIVAFAAYSQDKSKAKNGVWRTKEAVLLGLGFCGGAVGALLGMKVFRHKTKHWYFWVVNLLGLAWQVALIVFFILNN